MTPGWWPVLYVFCLGMVLLGAGLLIERRAKGRRFCECGLMDCEADGMTCGRCGRGY